MKLETAIEKATSEFLLCAELPLSSEVINQINKKQKQPLNSTVKKPVKLIRKRLDNKNPKVQILTIQLLQLAMNRCSPVFKGQVGSGQMIMFIQKIVCSRSTHPYVRTKLFSFIQQWSQQGVASFPRLQKHLHNFGIQFPIQQTRPPPVQPAIIKQKQQKQQESKIINNQHLIKQQKSQNLHQDKMTVRQQAEQIFKTSERENSSFSSGKFEKLLSDLCVVRENVELTNQILDAAEPTDNIQNYQLLGELVSTLRVMHQKIVSATFQIQEGEIMEAALLLKDDIEESIKRYNSLKKKEVVKPFESGLDQVDKQSGEKIEMDQLGNPVLIGSVEMPFGGGEQVVGKPYKEILEEGLPRNSSSENLI